MLDVRRLQVLGEVARRGSFSAAADALYLSQSAVSQQVAGLEREVGVPLLERTPEGPKPTDAGRLLIDHGDAAIARLEEAERDLAAIAGLEGGEVRIASFPSATGGLLMDALREFSKRYPGVDLSVTESEPESSLPSLRAADIDVAIVFDYPVVAREHEDRDIERMLLLTESMYLALPKDHRLASQGTVRIAELSDEPWLCGVRPSSCAEGIVAACREAGFEPRIAFESEEYHVLQGYVAAGLGVTLLPDLALPTLHPEVVVKATTPQTLQRRVWAAVRSKGARSAATEAMLEVLRESADRFAAGLEAKAAA
jgi:DNA-binding transcriptional LysR family regulator